jgi:hypothetical protein
MTDVSLLLLLVAYGLASMLSRGQVAGWLGLGVGQSASSPFARGFGWGLSFSLLVLAVLLAPNQEHPPFIYFQF